MHAILFIICYRYNQNQHKFVIWTINVYKIKIHNNHRNKNIPYNHKNSKIYKDFI